VTIIDPRAPFAVPSRYPGAEVLVAWPDEVLDAARSMRATRSFRSRTIRSLTSRHFAALRSRPVISARW